MFGYSAKEIIGTPVLVLIPPDRQYDELEIMERTRRGNHVNHYETARRRKDGTPVEISLTVSPLRDAAGVIVGASKIGRDITERKRAEEHQRALNAELDHRVKNVLATFCSPYSAEVAKFVAAAVGFCQTFYGRAHHANQYWRSITRIGLAGTISLQRPAINCEPLIASQSFMRRRLAIGERGRARP
jgi:PAS domain S-box-containing protein